MSGELGRKADAMAQMAGYVDATLTNVLTEAAKDLRKRAVKQITGKLALPSGYVAQHIRVIKPRKTGTNIEAGIQGTKRGVLLSRYPSQQLWAPKKHGNGRKRAGISGSVIKGSTYSAPKFFYIPGLRNGTGTGIAMRTGRGRSAYKVLHSLSVNQMLNHDGDDLLAATIDKFGSLGEQLAGEIVGRWEVQAK